MRNILLIIAIIHFSISSAQKRSNVEITINLQEKENKGEYSTILIFVKYLDESNRIDTLDTTKEFKKAEILKFKSAKIFLNVKYPDRTAGFYKYINRTGKLSYHVWNLKFKHEIHLDFLKDKFAYQSFLDLTLSDSKNFQQGIILNDYLSFWTFTSEELFQLSTINSNDFKSKTSEHIKIDSNKIKTITWIKNYDEKSIKKAKQNAEKIYQISGDTVYLNFKNLKFYFQNSPTFKLEYQTEVRR